MSRETPFLCPEPAHCRAHKLAMQFRAVIPIYVVVEAGAGNALAGSSRSGDLRQIREGLSLDEGVRYLTGTGGPLFGLEAPGRRTG